MANPVLICESQDTVNHSTGSTPTTTAAVPAGALVVIALQQDNNVVTFGCSAVSIDGHALTNAVRKSQSSSTGGEIWYIENCPAVASGATITYTYNGADSFCFIAKAAYLTGMLTSGALDKTGSASALASALQTASTGTLGQASETVFGVIAKLTGAGTFTEDAAFTTLGTFTDGLTADKDGLNFAFQNVAATTTVTYAPSYSVNSNNANLVASFKLVSLSSVPYTPYTQLGPILAQCKALGKSLSGWRARKSWRPRGSGLLVPEWSF